MRLRNIMISTLMSTFGIAAGAIDLQEYFPSEIGSSWNYRVLIHMSLTGVVDRKVSISGKTDLLEYERILSDSMVAGINFARGEYRDTCLFAGKHYCSSDEIPNPGGLNYSGGGFSTVDKLIPFKFEGAKYVKFENIHGDGHHSGSSLVRIAKQHVGLVYRRYVNVAYPYGRGEDWILTQHNDTPIDTIQIHRLVKASKTLFIETWIYNHSTVGLFMTGTNWGRNLLGREIPISGRHPEIVGGSLTFPR